MVEKISLNHYLYAPVLDSIILYFFLDGFFCKEKSASSNVCLSPHNTVIRDVYTRFYNCPIVNLREQSQQISSLTENESHCNILPANLVFETNKYFYLLQVFLISSYFFLWLK